MKVEGKIIPGYGVASGNGQDSRYPEGTLRLQYPFFKERGLDLGNYFLGTLNVDISPFRYKIKNPSYFFEAIDWSKHIPPENFYFFNIALIFEGNRHQGLIYMPGPETKVDHEQLSTVLEVIAPPLKNMHTGQIIYLEIDEESLEISIA
ncbi:MAG: hypothetical protein ACJART_001876 [Maribacter sp.]|jgi:hypothetical protein|tara:strand:+ start:1751 stop:2197 length:447 start_codon:yes stop_codon:yes gene_type:complete